MSELLRYKRIEDVQPGAHVCWLYQDPREQERFLVDFIHQGLIKNQKVAVVYDQMDLARILQNLAAQGIPAAQAVERQQLVFIPYAQFYLPDNQFNPEGLVDQIAAAAEQVLAEGYTALRAACDMTWVLRLPLDPGQILAYENRYNQLLQNAPVIAVCQYDRRLFASEYLLHIFQSHPNILIENEVHENPYFIPPAHTAPAESADASLECWMAFMTAKNHASQQLQESEKKFRLLYEDAPLAYQSLDANGCLIDVNPAWCALLGYPRDEALGMWFGDLLIPEQQALFLTRFDRFKARGQVQDVEFELVRKDGRHIIAGVNGQIGHDAQGNFRQTHCILTDITLKKQAEQELRAGEQLYKALFEQSPEIVLLNDPQSGAIVQANQAASTFFGYTQDDLCQMKISLVVDREADELEVAASAVADTAGVDREIPGLAAEPAVETPPPAPAGQAGFRVARGRLASGELRDIEVYSGPIEVGGQKRLYTIIHDVTAKKAAEAENRRVNEALRQRLVVLSQPLTELGEIQFEDLFNVEDIQAIQDAFSNATGVASIITRTDGRPITQPSNFCTLCNAIIRKSPKGLEHCIHSDRELGRPRANGPTIRPCLSGGLIDAGASIMVGEHHIANWLIGQVLDTDADLDQMMAYAAEIGVDPVEYRAALAEVPKMPAAQFAQVSQALYLISAQLSKLAVQNIEQARVISDREQAQIRLARVNRLYAVVSRISQTAVKVRSAQELYESVCQILIREGRFKMAWVGLLNEADGILGPVAWAGEEQGYLKAIVVRADPSRDGMGPAGRAFREKRIICSNDVDTDPQISWRDAALQRGYRSLASFPLITGEQAVGVLTVYSSEQNFFDDRENTLLQEISDTVSFALESIEKEKRRRTAEAALLESEEKYRRLFSSGNDAVFVYPILPDGQPGNFSEVNPKACERLGYSEAELLQLSIQDIATVADNGGLQRTIHNLILEKEMLFEASHRAKDGREIPVEVNSRIFEYQGQRFVQSIARDITERKQSEQQIQHQIQRLSALRTIDSAINMKFPLPAIMEVILTQLVEQLDISAAAILLYQPGSRQLQYAFGKGFQTGLIQTLPIPVNTLDLDAGDPIKGGDLPTLDAHTRQAVMAAEGFAAYHHHPVIAKDEVLGIIEVYHRQPLGAEKEWVDYLETLAGQAAIAIEDARLVDTLTRSNQELIQAYDETIAGWSRALDLRDHETEGHSRRVTEMTIQLARAMGFSETELVHIRRGALLHDIGKVGVPDRILLKPDSLNAEEWQAMKRHPQYAVDLLSPITFLRPALDIPHCHHEKWDGSGYPRGLRREEIPLSARIFAVVDVWDALLSDRSYRRGWPVKEVLAYIEEQSGKHFDPQVAAAFIRYLKSGAKFAD